MSKTISEYLPAKEEKRSIQAKVRKLLYDEFEPLLEEQGNTMVEFIEASMQKFIDEKSKKKLK